MTEVNDLHGTIPLQDSSLQLADIRIGKTEISCQRNEVGKSHQIYFFERQRNAAGEKIRKNRTIILSPRKHVNLIYGLIPGSGFLFLKHRHYLLHGIGAERAFFKENRNSYVTEIRLNRRRCRLFLAGWT